MAIVAALVLGFFLFEGIIFAAHYLMHQRWTGPLWESHQLHHRLYNPKHHTTDKFNPVGWKSFRFRAVIFVIVTAAIFSLLPLAMAVAVMTEVVVLAILTDSIHDATHTTEHPLARFAWFRRLQHLHWIHHTNVKKNFGVLTFFFDKLGGYFSEGELDKFQGEKQRAAVEKAFSASPEELGRAAVDAAKKSAE